jgi:hypothetical protein
MQSNFYFFAESLDFARALKRRPYNGGESLLQFLETQRRLSTGIRLHMVA